MRVKALSALVVCWLAATSLGAQPEPSRTTFAYDANGNLTSKVEAGVVWTYRYDARNLLIEVLRDGVSVESYRYDYQGRRIRRSSEADVVGYLWDDDQILSELDSTGATTARYGHGGERVLSVEHQSEGTLSYLFDGTGSPTSLSRPDGTLQVRYSYDAWGSLDKTTGGSENPFLFTGHLFDGATGLYYAKARYYDPEVGRFVTADPFEGTAVEPQSLHPYLYAYANPAAYVDRDGRCAGKLQGSDFCQAISRFFEHQIAGNPLALANRDVELHHKVMGARREFRHTFGREPVADEVVLMEGSRHYTAGFQEIDTSGRIVADHAEWSAVSAGVGGRIAYSSARAAGAEASSAVMAASRQTLDDAVSELTVVSPGDIGALARAGARSWSSGSPESGSRGAVVITESNGLGVDYRPLELSSPTRAGPTSVPRAQTSSSVTETPWGTRDNATGKFTAGPRSGIDPVDDFIAYAEQFGYEVVGREVSFRTPFGTRRADVLVRDPRQGTVHGIEIKSSVSEFDRANTQQAAADRYINRWGAEAIGDKAKDLGIVRLEGMTKVLWETP